MIVLVIEEIGLTKHKGLPRTQMVPFLPALKVYIGSSTHTDEGEEGNASFTSLLMLALLLLTFNLLLVEVLIITLLIV